MNLLFDFKDEPAVFTSWDWRDIKLVEGLRYVAWGQGVARNPVDVVFPLPILLYFGTSVPSAFYVCAGILGFTSSCTATLIP